MLTHQFEQLPIFHENFRYTQKLCCMSCSEIFLSQDGVFQRSTGCTKIFFSFCQPWWRPLVDTSLISQFRENVSSFNFLTKTMDVQHMEPTPDFRRTIPLLNKRGGGVPLTIPLNRENLSHTKISLSCPLP